MLSEETMRLWEFLSYLVTVLGLPIAIVTIWRELRAERANEAKELEQREDEIYVQLSQQYSSLLEAALAHPELDALDGASAQALTPDQKRRQAIYYEMLMALFERAFILLYEDAPSGQGGRRWGSWADFFSYWLKRPDFARYVEANLQGEDAAFVAFVRSELVKRPQVI
ncbi:MAG: hypothetical protein A3E78_06740 [Alphaproteobacteria bacterium RIFCSPHIGHO2_12_FULL_63_12]|nr:MAG: hypothetical protein A3E78_06740 [Alphaproteobacteria bacterium RIFCSPHIGHO2_12_FULL_63_12]